MLNNNKKIFIYNLCFDLPEPYANIQQDRKAKLDYHMSMLSMRIWRAGRGWELRGLKCIVRGGQHFFYLLCVCFFFFFFFFFGGGGGGGGSGSVPLFP